MCGAVASAVATAAASEPPTYSRNCTPYQNGVPPALAARRLAERQLGLRMSDGAALAAVEAYLAEPDASPRLTLPLQSGAIFMRNYQFSGVPSARRGGNGELVLLHVTSGGQVTWLVAAFDPPAKLLSVWKPADADVKRLYMFGRYMAAYVLLNDLLASDTVIPLRGCALAVKEKILKGLPEVQAETEHAFESAPAQDAASLNLVAQGYAAYAASSLASTRNGHELTIETLAKLGTNPAISFVYRDPGTALNGGREVAVVRIGSGAARTYSIVILSNGRAEIDTSPLCVMGDQRCASYYMWP